MSETTNRNLKAALTYAEKLGWPVFPTLPNKRPRTKNGFLDSTTDRTQIEEWWKMWPDAGIGIPTGAASGFWVLDLDKKEGVDGERILRRCEKSYGDLPPTLTQRTGGGGLHLFFAYPTNERAVKNDAGRKIANGVDVRGDGGYVVVPPSRHESGDLYEWDADLNPGKVKPAQAPEWLLKLVCVESGGEGEPRSAEYWRDMARSQPKGQRNDALASVAGKIFSSSLADSPALAHYLLFLYGRAMTPPLSVEEIAKTISSIVDCEFGRGEL